MKVLLWVCLFCCSVGCNANADRHHVKYQEMRETQKAKYDGLSATAKDTTDKRLSRMGEYDAKRYHLDNTGEFFVVEDIPLHQPAVRRRSELIVKQSQLRRGTPNSVAEGSTVHGVPIHHSLPGATNKIWLNFIGGTVTGTRWNLADLPDHDAVLSFYPLPFSNDATQSPWVATLISHALFQLRRKNT